MMDVRNDSGGSGGTFAITGGGSGFTQSLSPAEPLQNFDISVLSGLRDSDKYLGKNRVSDIKEAYQSYISGNIIGRGGQYGVDNARRFGTSITESLRGYLATVGLPTLTESNPVTPVNPTNPVLPDTTVRRNIDELLVDALPRLFGNAVYNPPLQSQAYGYSPTDSQTPLQSGGTNIGTFIIIGVIGVIGYFVYKRYVK